MPINNRGLYGQPVLPYTDNRIYAGSDVFVDYTFLDHTALPVTPASANYRLDDITNVASMIPITTFSPVSSTFTLQIPGAKMVFTYPSVGQGSQICQLVTTAVLPDGSAVQKVDIIEIIAIQTPN